MPINEFLFIDDSRLDQYIEQIGPALVNDKASEFGVSFSLLGPEIQAKQNDQLRPPTRTEKIKLLIAHLAKTNELGKGRFRGREIFSREGDFKIETCNAVQVFIPPADPESLVRKSAPENQREWLLKQAANKIGDFKGLTLWFSDKTDTGPESPEHRGQLILINDVVKCDPNHSGVRSGYNALTGLFIELADDLRKTILHNMEFEGARPPSKLNEDFLTDPIGTLRKVGARIGARRTITSLYRVREATLYQDPDNKEEAIATIAYPIFIVAGNFSEA